MEQTVVHSLRSCNDQVDEKPNAVEMFGYDFMVDEQYNTWILEINKSPTLESSTVISYSNFFMKRRSRVGWWVWSRRTLSRSLWITGCARGPTRRTSTLAISSVSTDRSEFVYEKNSIN